MQPNSHQQPNSSAEDTVLEPETAQPAAEERIAELEQALEQAKERAPRALADYQNLIRRTREERALLIRSAAKDFVEALLPSLEHLELANQQLDDPGIKMIISQLWKSLEEQGLKRIECLGHPFDVTTMEAVTQGADGDVVVSVVRPGFMLGGQVIQHAKVTLGPPTA